MGVQWRVTRLDLALSIWGLGRSRTKHFLCMTTGKARRGEVLLLIACAPFCSLQYPLCVSVSFLYDFGRAEIEMGWAG